MKNHIKARSLTKIQILRDRAIQQYDYGNMDAFRKTVEAIRSFEKKGDKLMLASSQAICDLMKHETKSQGFKDADEAWKHYHDTKEKAPGAATPEASDTPNR